MVYTPEQTGLFLDRAVRHRLYALYHLVALRGLRRGEACGVRWEDLDLDDAGTLTIRKELIQLGWEVEEGDPKTEASDATIALDSVTIAVLKAHRERQHRAEREWGHVWVDSGYAFTGEDGSPLHPVHVTDQFERLAFEAGLPPIRLHDLRHGAATLHLKAGAEMKIVQAMLRHASITTTSDIYTSVLPEVARDAAEAAAALVPRTADMSSGGTGGPITPARTADWALFANEERPGHSHCTGAPPGT
jgi:integrase